MNILPFGFPMSGATGTGAGELPPSGFGFAVALGGRFAGPLVGSMSGPKGSARVLPVDLSASKAELLPTIEVPSGEVPSDTSGVLPPAMSLAQLLTTAARISTPAGAQAVQTQGDAGAPADPNAAKAAPVEAAIPDIPDEQPALAEGPEAIAAAQPTVTQSPKPRKPVSAEVPESPAPDASIAAAVPAASAVAIPTQAAAPLVQQQASTAPAQAEPVATSPTGHRKVAVRANTGSVATPGEARTGEALPGAANFGDTMAKLAAEGQKGSDNGNDTGQQPSLPQAEKAANASTAPQPFQPAPAAEIARNAPVAAATGASPTATGEPEVAAQPGHLGQSLGVEIARKIQSGEETLRVRLNPVELGRIEVTLAFDDRGNLQATMRTESAQALDLLRQDVPELARTLDQAGVRADAQSFRFESRAGDGGGSQSSPHQQRGNQQHASAEQGDFETDDQPYRAIRGDGRVDLLA
ncbi:flagellar hook-length control protein FliK [Sphingomonas sp. DT-207]|uniref:flagellar hook-length control protein FliK n=1 Tax=Sphingomonas sp. DT-207 TaxID=3396167 RepID=UPI003F1DCD4F